MTETCDLAETMRDFFGRMHKAMDRLMTEHGASFARTKLLLHIAHQDFVRSADLAAAFGNAPRTITEAVDGLERDGLVRRDPDPSDRRVKRISITDAGRAAIESSEPMRRAFVNKVFTALEPEERVQLNQLLGKLTDRLRDMDRSGPQA